MTAAVGLLIYKTMGFRVSHEAETVGVDLALHAERAYSFGEVSGGHFLPTAASIGGHSPHFDSVRDPAPAPERQRSLA